MPTGYEWEPREGFPRWILANGAGNWELGTWVVKMGAVVWQERPLPAKMMSPTSLNTSTIRPYNLYDGLARRASKGSVKLPRALRLGGCTRSIVPPVPRPPRPCQSPNALDPAARVEWGLGQICGDSEAAQRTMFHRAPRRTGFGLPLRAGATTVWPQTPHTDYSWTTTSSLCPRGVC